MYIATLGSGITILTRSKHEFVHHFTGIYNIHGGFFLDENILVVYTGEQRLYFFQIPEKKLIWKCPRPKQLASSGDMRCCQIPGTGKIVCIAMGKQSLREHFYLLIDYNQQTIRSYNIPNCYRVVHSLAWSQSLGATFLSYEAKGDGKLQYRITGLDEDGTLTTLLEWEAYQSVNSYSGNYLFMNDHSKQEPQLMVYKLSKSSQPQKLVWEDTFQLPVPFFCSKGPVGTEKMLLPSISWVDEETGLLTSHTPNWIGVYSLPTKKLIGEFRQNNISYGTIINSNLYIGCIPGLWVSNLDSFTERNI